MTALISEPTPIGKKNIKLPSITSMAINIMPIIIQTFGFKSQQDKYDNIDIDCIVYFLLDLFMFNKASRVPRTLVTSVGKIKVFVEFD